MCIERDTGLVSSSSRIFSHVLNVLHCKQVSAGVKQCITVYDGFTSLGDALCYDFSLAAGGMTQGSTCKTMIGNITRREASDARFVDAACTLAVWGINAVAWGGTYEVIHALSSTSSLNSQRDVRLVVVGTTAVLAWMFLVGTLMVAFKWAVIGNFRDMASKTAAGECEEDKTHSRSKECVEPLYARPMRVRKG